MGEDDGRQGAGEKPVHRDAVCPLLDPRRPHDGGGELVKVHGVVSVRVHGGEELVDRVVEHKDMELLKCSSQSFADDRGLAAGRGTGACMTVECPAKVNGVLTGEEGADVCEDLLRETCPRCAAAIRGVSGESKKGDAASYVFDGGDEKLEWDALSSADAVG